MEDGNSVHRREQQVEGHECLWRGNDTGGCGATRECQREYPFLANRVCGFWSRLADYAAELRRREREFCPPAALDQRRAVRVEQLGRPSAEHQLYRGDCGVGLLLRQFDEPQLQRSWHG